MFRRAGKWAGIARNSSILTPRDLSGVDDEDDTPQDDILRLKLEGASMANMESNSTDWFGSSDCFWQAETSLAGPDGSVFWQGIYRSETIHNSLNPQWEAAEIIIDDPFQPIRFSIYDWEKKLKHQPMGHFIYCVDQLLESKAEKLEDGSWDLTKAITPRNEMGEDFGKIVVADVEYSEASKHTSVLNLTLQGAKLTNMLGFFKSVNDPFFLVETPARESDGTKWREVYKSETAEDDELLWDLACLNLKHLCQNNIDKPIRISWFDEAEYGPAVPLGHCITSVRRLTRSKAIKKGKKWDLTKALFIANDEGQEFGQAVVVDVEMVTYDGTEYDSGPDLACVEEGDDCSDD